MKLSLAELLPLKVTISKLIQEKLIERNDAAYVEFVKGEEAEEPSKSFEKITEELREVRDDYRKIDVLLSKANNDNNVDWEDGQVSITEAIELAKQLRGEIRLLKNFGRSKKMERISSFRVEESTYRKALFDPEKQADKASKLEKKVNRLSMAIEKTNHKVEIEFSEAKKYL